MNAKLTSILVTVYAVLLLLAGAILLFTPDEIAVTLEPATSLQPVLLQLLGAAFIGFAATNWTVRRTTIGGIYGRAVVAGNQAFAFIGLLVLLKGLPTEPSPAFWMLVLLLAFGAVLYSILLWRGPRLGTPPGDAPAR